MGGLLGQGAPDALNAAGFSDSPHFMYSGYNKDGEWYQLYQIGFGGIPGRPVGDGPDGHSLWPAFMNVPNEFLEAYFPLRIVTYETIPDSGGAGLHRGGNGVSLGYQFLEPGEISIHDDRWLTHPWGVNGGTPGSRSTKLMVRKDGSQQHLPSKCDKVKVEPGDTLYFNTWGGGGWGDPTKRDAVKVAMDAKRGLITRNGARRYGVVLRDDHTVDETETRRLRDRMANERGPAQLFDRGGSIEELKARCKRDTNLDPPSAPVFQKWMQKGKMAQAAE
jgi:N-methylhydantoinase B